MITLLFENVFAFEAQIAIFASTSLRNIIEQRRTNFKED